MSHTWAADWWIWHGARLLAYGIVLVAAYETVVTLYRQLGEHAQELEGHVQVRTAELLKANDALQTEIVERQRTQELLRETNQYLENLFNYANAPIIVWDSQFKITRFNHAFESLTGRRAEEVIGKSLEILFPRALVESSMTLIKKTTGGERWETVELSILHLDGAVRTVLWNSATVFAADGKTPVATIAQGQGITERKRAETALKTSEERFRTSSLSRASMSGTQSPTPTRLRDIRAFDLRNSSALPTARQSSSSSSSASVSCPARALAASSSARPTSCDESFNRNIARASAASRPPASGSMVRFQIATAE